jgi:ubiquinone/menaquinone biosynthesis C-methylase UbiE
MPVRLPQGLPDRRAALAQYQRRASVYDLELALFEPIRRRAIAGLDVGRGDTVLDVGCGTGLSLALLRERVGPRGRVIGIEQSPEMLKLARQRVAAARWRNVRLIESPVEEAELGDLADAALFHFTHDILRRPAAVARVMHHLRPGAHVVASGLKWARPLLALTNLVVLPAALRSVTSLEGLSQPWSHLQRHLVDLQVQQRLLGGVFIASGRRGAHREQNT